MIEAAVSSGDGPADGRPAAGRCRSAWLTLGLAAGLALAADLVTKSAAFRYVAGDPVIVDPAQVRSVLEADPSKASALIPQHDPVTVAPGLLDLTLVLNAGAVFGAGQGKRFVFIGFTFAALAFAVYLFATRTRRGDWASHAAIALVIGGGLGNLYDRVRLGVVRDFLHPLPGVELPWGLRWPNGASQVWPYVSNVADAFLIVGIGWLVIRLWRGEPGARPGGSADAD